MHPPAQTPPLDVDGFSMGVLHCQDPKTGEEHFIYSTSGSVAEAEERCRLMAPHLPANYVIANPVLHPSYWSGRQDPRFIPGRNPDGSLYAGDSTACAEPRILQCARDRGWTVRGMTIAWNGSSPNPLPDLKNNPDGQYMRRCPSCEANANSLMAGVPEPAKTRWHVVLFLLLIGIVCMVIAALRGKL
ncbi:MAG: hypothetical protein ACJ76N_03235 [Thermoanaerobaculia bacterium]